MTDCQASNNAGRGINIFLSSILHGLRLEIDDNASRGLAVNRNSSADCTECDLNSSVAIAAHANFNSSITLGDSVVTGRDGLLSTSYSYIDIDCSSIVTAHPCSLNVSRFGGRAFDHSTVAFFGAGEFSGQLLADGQSEAQLVGARQVSTGVNNSNQLHNNISNNSSLRVGPGDDGVVTPIESRLMGTTDVREFSNALIFGAGTELEGVLNCISAGDAWVDPAVDLTNFTFNGCEHAP